MSKVLEIRPGEVDKLFELVAPLLEPVVGAAKGEFTLEDIRERAKRGDTLLLLAIDDEGIPTMAGAFEVIHYPRKRVLNVMALGGKNLRAAAAEHLPMVRAFARFVMADEIRAYCSPAMARKLRRDVGAETIYHVVSIPVEEQP